MPTPEQPEPAVSFDDFLKNVEPKLKKVLALYRIPGDDAEDVLQQTLLSLLYQWDRIRDPEVWLLGTLKRHCLMYWRTHRRRIYSAVDSTILEWLSEPVAPSQERADLICDLENLIGRLPTRCRSLLQLRFQFGYETPEVAERLGYRASSIGKITNRCLAALSREMLIEGLAEEMPGALSGALKTDPAKPGTTTPQKTEILEPDILEPDILEPDIGETDEAETAASGRAQRR